MKKDLRSKIKDWLPEVRGFARMQFAGIAPQNYTNHDSKNKIMVVFLPGIFNKWAFYKPLTDSISLAGYDVYTIPGLGHNLKDIPTSAKIVSDLIEKEDLKNVVFVCHSKGGG